MDIRQDNLDYYFSGDWMRQYHDGIQLLKYPSDLEHYKKEITKRKPDVIIETGTLKGGSSVFFQDLVEKVITIDPEPQVDRYDPRITYIKASSTDPETIKQIKPLIKGKKVMVVLDADHTKAHVDKEIELYAPLVTKGQLFVIEDTMFSHYLDNRNPANSENYENGSCGDSAQQWDKKGFREIEHPAITMNPHGWFERL